MNVLLIFNNNIRLVSDTMAMVLPYSPHQIKQQIELSKATASEIEQLKNNPYNDSLLAEISARG